MDVQALPKVGLYFRFYGESFDPDEITRRLGVQPTNMYRPGDPIDEAGRARWPGYGWVIKVGPRRTLDLEDMLRELRERANVTPATARQLCAEMNLDLVITCGVGAETADTMPAMFFPSDFLAWIAELDASLNVHVSI